jgi:ABC-type transport system substrate-binding protein
MINDIYPFVPQNSLSAFRRDSFLAPSHWAYDESLEAPEFDPVAAAQLLEEAGWVLPPGETVRVAQGALYAEEGANLSFDLTGLDSPTRRTWVPQLAEQWRENCGADVQVTFVPSSILLDTGEAGSLSRRDFEVVIFPWTTGANPLVEQFYGCAAIPTAQNDWTGFNFVGWCNPAVEGLIDELRDLPGASLEERAEIYNQIEEQFFGDTPSIPLYSSGFFYGANSNLQNFAPQPIDQFLWNIDTWTLPNEDTVVVRSSQEPANLLTDRSLAAQNVAGAIHDRPAHIISYTLLAHSLTQVPTAANGGVQEQNVNVLEGDVVFNTDGDLVTLVRGVEVQLADGSEIIYQGGAAQMVQLAANYEFEDGLKWSDGTPITAQDFELAFDAICSPQVGIAARCDPIDQATFTDNGFSLTFFPGFALTDFSVPPFTFYPAHQVIQSEGEHQGKTLAEVPFEDWLTLPEVTDIPLTTGPFQVTNWIHGQQMDLVANQFYRLGPPNFDQLTIRFDMTNAEAFQALVDGTVHVADGIAGSNTPDVAVHVVPSSSWEHIDFNFGLYDYTASKVISATTGGKVTNPLGGIVTVPPGAFSSNTTVSINHRARPSQSLSKIGTPIQIFDVTLTGSSGQPISATLQPLEMTFVYSPAQVSGLNEQTFNVVKLDGDTWELLLPCDGCSVDTAENKVTVRTSSFGELALVGRSYIYTPLLVKE